MTCAHRRGLRACGIAQRLRRIGAQRVVTKLLLIICDCRISAIGSLQKRHTLGDNAGRESYLRGGSTADCHIRGLPSISAQRNSCLQNGLCGKRPQGLGFRSVPRSHRRVVSKPNSPPLAGCRRPTSFAQICKLIQNIMTQLAARRRSAPARLGASSLARRVREVVAGGTGRAIFTLPLGHRRFSVKGSYSSSSKMRTDDLCLVVLGFNFDFASAWRVRT